MERQLTFNEKCENCGDCADVCPRECIVMRGGRVKYIEHRGCIACGQCVAVCWRGAIEGRETIAISNLLEKRRSIRLFQPEHVPGYDVQRIFTMVAQAPAPHNERRIEWSFVHNPSKLLPRLAEAAPHLRRSLETGTDPIFFHAPHLVIAHSDPDVIFGKETAIIALTYFELAAAEIGYGTCWMGNFMSVADTYKKWIGVPMDNVIHGAVVLGVPDVRYTFAPKRFGTEPKVVSL